MGLENGMGEAVGEIMEIGVEAIVPSPFNSRYGKKLTKQEEDELIPLRDSIVENGLLHPIVVRWKPEERHYELVVGERRWRATMHAGLGTIDARVTELSDDEVMKAILVENQQRCAVDPLREAEHFARVRRTTESWTEVSQRTGIPTRTVRKMVELLNLPKMAKEQLRKRLITVDQAFLLVGLPKDLEEAELQGLLEDISASPESGYPEPASLGDTREAIRRLVGHKLSDATWDIADAGFGGGACNACDKRTGADLLLFEDIVEEDRCLDSRCWDAKIAVTAETQIEQLRREGCYEPTAKQKQKWLTGSKQLRTPWSGPIDLNEKVPEHLFVEKVRRCQWKTLLSPYLKSARPKRYAVVDGDGVVHEVIESAGASRWCAANKVFGERKKPDLPESVREEDRKGLVNELAVQRVHLQVLHNLNEQWKDAPLVETVAAAVCKCLDNFGTDRIFTTPAGIFGSKMSEDEVRAVVREGVELHGADYLQRALVALQVIELGWKVRGNWKGEIHAVYSSWAEILGLDLKKMLASAKSWAGAELRKKEKGRAKTG